MGVGGGGRVIVFKMDLIIFFSNKTTFLSSKNVYKTCMFQSKLIPWFLKSYETLKAITLI